MTAHENLLVQRVLLLRILATGGRMLPLMTNKPFAITGQRTGRKNLNEIFIRKIIAFYHYSNKRTGQPRQIVLKKIHQLKTPKENIDSNKQKSGSCPKLKGKKKLNRFQRSP